MLIKCKIDDETIYINFEKVSKFETFFDDGIRIYFNSEDFYERILFKSKEERDKAIENLINFDRWKEQICDLDN